MIRIKRVDKEFPLPEYKTSGAAAFDLYTRENVVIPAQGWGKAPSNIVLEIPSGMALMISARSSLAKNYPGLFLANGVGLIDSDYCGDQDEILISLYNFTKEDIIINKGERIAQAFLVRFIRDSWEEVEAMENKDRGGFGSTGLSD
jgi:dUTP pyrophosphatase